MKTPSKDKLSKGIAVSIETKENQGTNNLTNGTISEILTKNNTHPHGIKVKLKDGQVGRVKKLLQNVSKSIIIPKVEDKHNEFKEFFQYDKSIENVKNPKVIDGIKRTVQERFARSVCSFGNDKDGGIIYLGINSDGEIVGLEPDRKLGNFSDYNDEFVNHIGTVLEKFILDKLFLTSKIDVTFHKINEKTIGIVKVAPSDTPLYLNEYLFFVRGFAPRAEKLEPKDQVRYIRERFLDFKL